MDNIKNNNNINYERMTNRKTTTTLTTKEWQIGINSKKHKYDNDNFFGNNGNLKYKNDNEYYNNN